MEDPSSPTNGQSTETASNNTSNIGNKPIKKKASIYADEDSSYESPDDDGSPPFSPPSMRELESKARKELVNFLESKHIDAKYADMYEVHVRLLKKRKSNPGDHGRKSDTPGYSVTYSSPEGSILTSKGDVLASIHESKRRSTLAQSKSGAVAGVSYAHKLRCAY